MGAIMKLRMLANEIDWNVYDNGGIQYDLRKVADEMDAENAKLREIFGKVYGYYVSGTLTPCDFCDIYSCEGNAPTVCKADEYDPDGIVTEEIDRLMRELGIEES